MSDLHPLELQHDNQKLKHELTIANVKLLEASVYKESQIGLSMCVMHLLGELQVNRVTIDEKTIEVLREHLNHFTKPHQEIIKDYLKTY